MPDRPRYSWLVQVVTIDLSRNAALPAMRLAVSARGAREAATCRLGVALGKGIQLGQIALNLQLLVKLKVHLALPLYCLPTLLSFYVLLDVN